MVSRSEHNSLVELKEHSKESSSSNDSDSSLSIDSNITESVLEMEINAGMDELPLVHDVSLNQPRYRKSSINELGSGTQSIGQRLSMIGKSRR